MKVCGGRSADKTHLLLVQDIYHLAQSIFIFVLGNGNDEKVYICVGIESKVDDEVIYTPKKAEFDILNIHQAFEQLVVNDTPGANFVQNRDYKELGLHRKQLAYDQVFNDECDFTEEKRKELLVQYGCENQFT
ncbi:unnamed protein product [Adineta steineri]|uniref:Uncharacterized protein n=1 Tax=Adineta steineri TaxID=433720 RepID=A0A815T3V6_9BILA|nr:unnamed protein product [Adineta steineri]CAF1500257.1 unnamed protein product [Adineta steineri]